MLEVGATEPSQSEWASPPVLLRKRDGTLRYCIDNRAVNSVLANGAYLFLLNEECRNHLYRQKWYCCLDMNSGYWQIPINEEDKCKTTFITKYSLLSVFKAPLQVIQSTDQLPAHYASRVAWTLLEKCHSLFR